MMVNKIKWKGMFILYLISMISSGSILANNLTDYLMPIPKEIKEVTGSFNGKTGRIIAPAMAKNSATLPIIKSFQSSLQELSIETTIAARSAKDEIPLLWINLTPELPTQTYKISINTDQILVEGGDEAGLYYALQTFKQIVNYARDNGSLPLLHISDAPDFKRRGIMLDVSRNKVPTMHTLKNLVKLFASWKINEIQLYTENTFAYKNHSDVWKDFSPMTAEDVLELNQFCREHYIDLVPNQTSFGHMNQWLSHDKYQHLAELTGDDRGHVMSPILPETFNLMSELYAELLPNFTSQYFNINSDETEALGSGRSKAAVEEKGGGRVYLDYILKLKNEVDKYGRTTQFWGDIILKYPELIPELPKDMIALVWGYEDKFPFNENLKKFSDAGSPFYVCPGTSSWLSLVGRNQISFDNLENAAVNGIKYGALGFLNTDWGDYGHWQPLSVSYPTYLFGAAVSWGYQSNKQIDVANLISRYVLEDATGKSGKALLDLGNTYLKTNSLIYNEMLISPDRPIRESVTPEGLNATINWLEEHLDILLNAPMECEDAEIVKKEMKQAVNMAVLGCNIAQARFNKTNDIQALQDISPSKRKALSSKFEKMIKEYRDLWIVRNRPGGLQVSAGNLENGLSKLQN